MALRTDKAYVRHIRADTYSNLTGALKDGELGLVKNGKRVVINDNAAYNDFALHKTVPEFDALQISSQLTQSDNGGTNQAAAGVVTLADEGEIIFNPTSLIKSHYKLAVSAAVGRRVTLKNTSAFPVSLGEVANMQHGAVVVIPSNKATEILSDGTKWWWSSVSDGEEGSVVLDTSAVINEIIAETHILEYTRIGQMCTIHFNYNGNVVTLNSALGVTSTWFTFGTSDLPASILPPSGGAHRGVGFLIYEGLEQTVNCALFSNGDIDVYRNDGSFWTADEIIDFNFLSFVSPIPRSNGI